nr:SIR2 family protein [Rhizobium cauense]
MLALEGSVGSVATANWDGLLEAAIRDLGYDPRTFFQITVDGDDLRGPPAAGIVYKFHGCALRAIEDENHYRKLLIARSAQIVQWMNNDTFKIVRDQLLALIQRRQTLMIGLSAQDVNIQNLFAKIGAHKGWKWDSVLLEQETDDPLTSQLLNAAPLGKEAVENVLRENISAPVESALTKALSDAR